MDSEDIAINMPRLQAGAGTQLLPPQQTKTQFYASLPLLGEAAEPGGAERIRLLHLDGLPSQEPEDGSEPPLTGQLHIVSLVDFPDFTALSYVWGEYALVSGTSTLTLRNNHGEPFVLDITPNCRDGLRAIRRRFGPIRIWVDAVCINQNDNAEKAFQVPLMGDIYTLATMVYVWLGPGPPALNMALRYFNRGSLGRYRPALLLDLPRHWVDIGGPSADAVGMHAKLRFLGDIARGSIYYYLSWCGLVLWYFSLLLLSSVCLFPTVPAGHE